MTIRYDGRVAVVTGAGAGLGRSHALYLAGRGARVVVNDLGGAVDGRGGDKGAAQSVVDEIRGAGGEAVANTDSVADRAGAARVVAQALDAWGRIDILVNNAGILRDKTFAKLDLDDFEAVLDVHLMGSVHCTKAAWPAMIEQKYGRVVLTTSAAGLYGNFGQSNYATAKLALVGLMNALKLEGLKYGVRVNTVAPIAATRMTAGMFPPAVAARLTPDYVTALVGWFAAEGCEASGDIVECGAGYYAKAEMVEGAGIAFPAGQAVTADDVAGRYGEITDMRTARPAGQAMDLLARVFQAIAAG